VVETLTQAHQAQGLLRRHGIAGDLGDDGDVLAGGEARDQIVELEDEADGLAAKGGELATSPMR
jgi:hypothetical protein